MKTDKQKVKRALKELKKTTEHITETDLATPPPVEEEPTVRIDGEAVITVANLQKLINSLVFKLLST